jgi:hypothetical protein
MKKLILAMVCIVAATGPAFALGGTAKFGNLSIDGTSVLDGTVTIGLASATNATIQLKNASNANTLTIDVGAVTGNYTLTLPVAPPPAANKVLKTDSGGSATLEWDDLGETLPASTQASSILRGNGAGGWVEETSLTIDASGNLSTSGSVTCTQVSVDNLLLDGAAITSDTGAISFDNDNLSTTGTLDVDGTTTLSGSVVLDAAAGSLDFSGATSATITASTTGVVLFGDDNIALQESAALVLDSDEGSDSKFYLDGTDGDKVKIEIDGVVIAQFEP